MRRNRSSNIIQLAAGAIAVACFANSALAEPRITFAKPLQNERYSGTSYLDVEGMASDPSGLKSIRISLNNQPLSDQGQRGVELRERVLPILENLQGVEQFPVNFRIPVGKLNDGANEITFRVENLRGEIAVAHRAFVHDAPKGTVYLAAIGINRYQDAVVPRLKYAENDALAVADYFRNHLGVPSNNIFTLVGREATERNIKKLLGVTLTQKAGRNDQVVIYYAGHGVPEFDTSLSEGDQVEKYLLPWDGETDGLYATAVPMREIDFLSRRFVSERVVFIFDTCFSGSVSERHARARTIPPVPGQRSLGRRLDEGFLKRMTAAKGKVILTASGINQPSHEIDELGHGVFTYYLLEGMMGQADLDADGIVGVSEIYKYVSGKVSARTGNGQTPTYFVSETVVGEIILGRSGPGSYSFNIRDSWAGVGDDGRLAIQVEPADASIFIDGTSRITSRGFINTTLRAGPHSIKIQKAGYKPKIFEQSIARHELSELFLNLEPVSPIRYDSKTAHRPPPP
jgi:hypothetical protein